MLNKPREVNFMNERHDEKNVPLMVDVEQLASATECTGLVPAAIQTPQEGQDYAELYAIHQQKPAWKKEQNGKPEPRKEGY